MLEAELAPEPAAATEVDSDEASWSSSSQSSSSEPDCEPDCEIEPELDCAEASDEAWLEAADDEAEPVEVGEAELEPLLVAVAVAVVVASVQGVDVAEAVPEPDWVDVAVGVTPAAETLAVSDGESVEDEAVEVALVLCSSVQGVLEVEAVEPEAEEVAVGVAEPLLEPEREA